ncbi:MAG: hypothetical protein QM488_12765 [Rhizobiaceae bacterium]
MTATLKLPAPMTPAEIEIDKADAATAVSLITQAMNMKRQMRADNVIQISADCPWCGDTIDAVLLGPKQHVHIACRGKCGMEIGE